MGKNQNFYKLRSFLWMEVVGMLNIPVLPSERGVDA
jgi:hypothetical protein